MGGPISPLTAAWQFSTISAGGSYQHLPWSLYCKCMPWPCMHEGGGRNCTDVGVTRWQVGCHLPWVPAFLQLYYCIEPSENLGRQCSRFIGAHECEPLKWFKQDGPIIKYCLTWILCAGGCRQGCESSKKGFWAWVPLANYGCFWKRKVTEQTSWPHRKGSSPLGCKYKMATTCWASASSWRP